MLTQCTITQIKNFTRMDRRILLAILILFTRSKCQLESGSEEDEDEDDYGDIDNFDFELDKWGSDDDINLKDSTIPPSAWTIILDNVAEIIKTYDLENEDRTHLEKDIVRLKELEDLLVQRGSYAFEDNEQENKSECAYLEYQILEIIKMMDPQDQINAMDIDHDGEADFII